MSRPGSQSSLNAQYANQQRRDSDVSQSTDWCNAFWGQEPSAGYDAVLGRIKAGSKTLEDLRTFYSQRAAIEEDYAKKLNKLSKQHLGRDELGLTKQALDRVRLETANTADAHEKLAAMVRTFLEAKTRDFEAQRENKKRNPQALIEKAFKNKLSQEQAVQKACDKYRTDCISVNGYTAQTSLVQGRELDKAQAKLDKAQATIAVNEREYRLYVNTLKETTSKWQIDWKGFCDLAQDIEEERLNYLRVSLWEYANGVSFICVTDDEFCENIRKHLETCDAPSDLALFVSQHGSGGTIFDPPTFVDYAAGDHGTNARPSTRPANFARSSARQEIVHTGQSLQDLTNAIKPMAHPPPTASGAVTPTSEHAGRSGRRSSQHDIGRAEVKNVTRQQSYGENLGDPPSIASQQTILSAPPVRRAQSPSKPTDSLQRQPSQREIARENYRRSVTGNQPATNNTPQPNNSANQNAETNANDKRNSYAAAPTDNTTRGRNTRAPAQEDSLEAALAALRNPATASEAADNLPHAKNRPPSTYGMDRSKSQRSNTGDASISGGTSGGVRASPHHAPQFQQPSAAAIQAQRRQSQASLAQVRPASPAVQAPQGYRAVSPAPSASLMQAPQQGPNAYSAVVDQYGQALPGERSRSRAGSIASARSRPDQQAPSHQQQPYPQSQSQPHLQQGGYFPVQQTQPHQPQQQFAPAAQQTAVNPPGGYRSQSTRPVSPGPVRPAQGQPQGQSYGSTYGQPPAQYTQSPSQYGFQQPRPTSSYSQRSYQPPSSDNRQPSPQPAQNFRQQAPPGSLTPAQSYAAQVQNSPALYRSPSAQNFQTYSNTPPANTYNSAYGQYQPPQQHTPQPQQVQQQQPIQAQQQIQSQAPNQQQARPGSIPPVRAPTGHFAQGRPVLFFVRALYDYQASMPDEFSFQADDVIAVFATDDDGWWQGELLDENRRHLGGSTFPSNFCTLLE